MVRFCAAVLVLGGLTYGASVRPVELRCEYRTDPLGIDVVEPRLSWALAPVSAGARGLRQTAYRIIVASTDQKLRAGDGDLWDSGRVESDQSVHVGYRGKPLMSNMRAAWKVQVWDQDSTPSTWSDPALWTMGLLNAADWKATWIGRDEDKIQRSPSSPYWNLEKAHWIWVAHDSGGAGQPRFFRGGFGIPADRKIKRATAVVAADNHFEMFVNGAPAGKGDQVQMPEVLDITARLRAGQNWIAVQGNHGRANSPAGIIAAIRVEFTSGEPLIVYSDRTWRASTVPASGWHLHDFDFSAWSEASEVGAYGAGPWGEVGFSEERSLPARMVRKEFTLPRKVTRATAFVSGLGLFELYVNGKRIGDHVLSPGLTDYEKHAFYVTHDVSPMLAAGKNAIGVLLGNGRFWAPRAMVPVGMRSFGYPKAIVQVELEFDDGSHSQIVSDDTWKLSTGGAIRANNEYDGEEYDARMEHSGWTRPAFNDSQWEQAHIVAAPTGKLVAQMAEPLRVTETLHPVKLSQIKPGVYIFDLGQNMVGWCRLRVAGKKGTVVTLRHAETLREDGSLYVDNLRSARATDEYTLRGGGVEVWEPRFTYHGFRYVEITGFPGTPTLASLEGRVVHDAMTPVADFTSSSELLNHIHKNIFWGVRGNYRSIPTDCPQRDERHGWLGDRSQVSRGESYLFDVAAFYSKWMDDLVDSQRPNGSIPDVSPAYWVFYNDNVTWPSTFILAPGMLYDQYGDRRVLERNYPAMKKWIEYMRGFLKDDLMPKDTYGDWCVPPESPKLIHSQDPARKTDPMLLGTAYYYDLLRLMARYARLLDHASDASEFDTLAGRVKTAFHKKYFNPQTGLYSNGTETSSILPLAFDMTPQQNRNTVFAGLIHKIEGESKGHVGTGLVGAQWLMRTLSENGRADVAYRIATQTTYPGWGYMIEKGATTIWELWNGDTADPAMNSGNHVMQIGDLGVWMYEYLAGIRADPQKPGFKHAIVHPYPVADLSFVKASHRSMYGTLASEWRRQGSTLQLNVTVPPNTTATLYVPAKDRSSVTEPARGATFVRVEGSSVIYELESGSYSFTTRI